MSLNSFWLSQLKFGQQLFFDDHIISTRQCEQILGVMIDDRLSIKEQIYDCVTKLVKYVT